MEEQQTNVQEEQQQEPQQEGTVLGNVHSESAPEGAPESYDFTGSLPEGMEAAFRQARHIVRFFRLYTYIRLTSLTSVVRSSAGNQSIAVLPLSSCISASRDMRIICHVGSSFGRAPSSSMDTVP